jgi:tetrahydromethanopterin S-methyltransferase subunit G
MHEKFITCASHSGFDEKLNNLALTQQTHEIKLQKLDDKIEETETHVFTAINKIYFLLITILGGLVLNLVILFFKGLQQ